MHEGVLKIFKFYEVTVNAIEHCFSDGQQIDNNAHCKTFYFQ